MTKIYEKTKIIGSALEEANASYELLRSWNILAGVYGSENAGIQSEIDIVRSALCEKMIAHFRKLIFLINDPDCPVAEFATKAQAAEADALIAAHTLSAERLIRDFNASSSDDDCEDCEADKEDEDCEEDEDIYFVAFNDALEPILYPMARGRNREN